MGMRTVTELNSPVTKAAHITENRPHRPHGMPGLGGLPNAAMLVIPADCTKIGGMQIVWQPMPLGLGSIVGSMPLGIKRRNKKSGRRYGDGRMYRSSSKTDVTFHFQDEKHPRLLNRLPSRRVRSDLKCPTRDRIGSKYERSPMHDHAVRSGREPAHGSYGTA